MVVGSPDRPCGLQERQAGSSCGEGPWRNLSPERSMETSGKPDVLFDLVEGFSPGRHQPPQRQAALRSRLSVTIWKRAGRRLSGRCAGTATSFTKSGKGSSSPSSARTASPRSTTPKTPSSMALKRTSATSGGADTERGGYLIRTRRPRATSARNRARRTRIVLPTLAPSTRRTSTSSRLPAVHELPITPRFKATATARTPGWHGPASKRTCRAGSLIAGRRHLRSVRRSSWSALVRSSIPMSSRAPSVCDLIDLFAGSTGRLGASKVSSPTCSTSAMILVDKRPAQAARAHWSRPDVHEQSAFVRATNSRRKGSRHEPL